MNPKDVDPSHLDVQAFARAGGTLQGRWPVEALPRLSESAMREALATEPRVVDWQASGELRPTRGGPAEVWLHLRASAHVPLECQRCLAPVEESLDIDRSIRFVAGEETAAELDEESEDDVLALTRALDLRELIEDELLLALPIVPRHEVCPEPLLAPPDPEEEGDVRPNPFAALAALKGTERPN